MAKEQSKRSVDKTIFVEEYVSNGENGAQAVIAAGFVGTYASARVAAHRLLTDDNIRQAIESRKVEIHGQIQTEYMLTRKRQCEKLQAIADKAIKNNQFSAAVKALNDQSRICGLFSEDNKQKAAVGLVEAIARLTNGQSIPALPTSKRVDSQVIDTEGPKADSNNEQTDEKPNG